MFKIINHHSHYLNNRRILHRYLFVIIHKFIKYSHQFVLNIRDDNFSITLKRLNNLQILLINSHFNYFFK